MLTSTHMWKPWYFQVTLKCNRTAATSRMRPISPLRWAAVNSWINCRSRSWYLPEQSDILDYLWLLLHNSDILIYILQQTIVLFIFLLAIFALTSANLLEEKILLSREILSPGLTVLLSHAIRRPLTCQMAAPGR